MGGGGIARDRLRGRCGCLSGDRPGANDYPIGLARNRVGGRAWAPDAPTRRGTPKYRKLSAGGESGVGEACRSAHPWGPVLTVAMDVQESSETHWRSGQGGLAGEFDDYSLQSGRKSREGASHPDRNAQFEHINATADEGLQHHQPVISVDTKKKELVGEFKNAGREWQPKNKPETGLVHDFPQDASGKAIPYGIYDMSRNEAWVNVGRDHDTPAFAVASIRRWWKAMGKRAYPNAEELFIAADAAAAMDIAPTLGSTNYRSPPTKLVSRSASATSPRARVNGTRLSTACSVTLPRTGGARRCVASRPSSIRSATLEPPLAFV